MQVNSVKVTQYLERATFFEFNKRSLKERSAKCLSFPQKGKQTFPTKWPHPRALITCFSLAYFVYMRFCFDLSHAVCRVLLVMLRS